MDKAAAIGFEYSMVDAGWEGWSDKFVTLKDLVDYARLQKVGIWVWKSYKSLKTDSGRKQFFKALHEAGQLDFDAGFQEAGG